MAKSTANNSSASIIGKNLLLLVIHKKLWGCLKR
jgi:hypothetical protein